MITMTGKPRGPKSDKIWADAVRMAALRESAQKDPSNPGKYRKKLNVIADNLVDAAMDGDMAAIKEVGDRLDGKPKVQTVVTDHEGDALPVTQVVYQIHDPQRREED